MKICERCHMAFEEEKIAEQNIVDELANYFLQGMDSEDIENLCPQCREELGFMNIMGFDK